MVKVAWDEKERRSCASDIGGGRGQWLGGHHGERGARAYNGGLGAEPQRGPRAEPLVRGSGGRSPPEAESILVIGCPTEPANLAPFQKCLALQGMNGLIVDLSSLRKTSANN